MAGSGRIPDDPTAPRPSPGATGDPGKRSEPQQNSAQAAASGPSRIVVCRADPFLSAHLSNNLRHVFFAFPFRDPATECVYARGLALPPLPLVFYSRPFAFAHQRRFPARCACRRAFARSACSFVFACFGRGQMKEMEKLLLRARAGDVAAQDKLRTMLRP